MLAARDRLGPLVESATFRAVLVKVPANPALQALLGQVATIHTLMEAQHRVAALFSAEDPSGRYGMIASGLSQYAHANTFLWLADVAPEAYCLEMGFSRNEIARMDAGELIILDLFEHHPGSILYPLIRGHQTIH